MIATEQRAANVVRDDLASQAARLYPLSQPMQTKWLRAVRMVRSTKHGWILDKPITKEQCNAQQN